MFKCLVVCPLVLSLGIGNSAFAQTQAVVPVAVVAPIVTAPVASSSGPDALGKYMLREGEDVNLTFAQDLSSKTSSEGDPVALTLVDDLKVGNIVVAKAGAHAMGEVTKAEKSGMMGKAGSLNLRLDYIKVGDTKIRLRGTKGKEGASGTTGAVVLTVLFGPLGLIKHGKNVEIKQGSSLHAFVADDVALLPIS
ncbi:hypothetical protein BH10ACI4_BH10ACI4_35370 [soil metagenome]